MNDIEQQTATETVPTCYRHPTRETRVSCGRCGRPVCPDCMEHGPVGVRCQECLYPQRAGVAARAPIRIALAVGVALGAALLWVALLLFSGLIGSTGTPNLLLTAIAGGVDGWLIWRICGRTADRRTIFWAIGLGAGMPIVAAVATLVLLKLFTEAMLPMDLRWWARVLLAAGIGGFFAWISITRRFRSREILV